LRSRIAFNSFKVRITRRTRRAFWSAGDGAATRGLLADVKACQHGSFRM